MVAPAEIQRVSKYQRVYRRVQRVQQTPAAAPAGEEGRALGPFRQGPYRQGAKQVGGGRKNKERREKKGEKENKSEGS